LTTAAIVTLGFQKTLEQKQTELVQALRTRDCLAIEKSADHRDEIQHAYERDLAFRNVDRGSNLLRDVKAALQRLHDGSFGTCVDCESPINSKRLAAVPWASRCIHCQEAAERLGQRTSADLSDSLEDAA
jgi:DnaK suppressor protein